ncbi:hypothetical protein JTE90_023780 [Oedothorax gibbosus]|uniref:Uncharacterized protein n=1 Tax=Oedothorax gibbosus TaxID=931172 RepID=A0AAV6URE7_9ARAC|nr:hypothetical protein JTE90_023780 [Oedothorax gibbosus]
MSALSTDLPPKLRIVIGFHSRSGFFTSFSWIHPPSFFPPFGGEGFERSIKMSLVMFCSRERLWVLKELVLASGRVYEDGCKRVNDIKEIFIRIHQF